MRLIMDDNRPSAAGLFISHKKNLTITVVYRYAVQMQDMIYIQVFIYLIKIRRNKGTHFKVNITWTFTNFIYAYTLNCINFSNENK